jgi:hypothetical protein
MVAKKKSAKKPKRPTKKTVGYSMIEECRTLAGYGLTYQHMADYFDIKFVTFQRMVQREPKLEAAIKNGKARIITEMAGLLVQKAREGNVTAMMFYLKTQARFSEWQENTTTPDTPKTSYIIKTTDPIEAARIYQQIMTGS